MSTRRLQENRPGAPRTPPKTLENTQKLRDPAPTRGEAASKPVPYGPPAAERPLACVRTYGMGLRARCGRGAAEHRRRQCRVWGRSRVAKPYKFIGFGAIDATKPPRFIRLGATDVTKPSEIIRCGGDFGPLSESNHQASVTNPGSTSGHGRFYIKGGSATGVC